MSGDHDGWQPVVAAPSSPIERLRGHLAKLADRGDDFLLWEVLHGDTGLGKLRLGDLRAALEPAEQAPQPVRCSFCERECFDHRSRDGKRACVLCLTTWLDQDRKTLDGITAACVERGFNPDDPADLDEASFIHSLPSVQHDTDQPAPPAATAEAIGSPEAMPAPESSEFGALWDAFDRTSHDPDARLLWAELHFGRSALRALALRLTVLGVGERALIAARVRVAAVRHLADQLEQLGADLLDEVAR